MQRLSICRRLKCVAVLWLVCAFAGAQGISREDTALPPKTQARVQSLEAQLNAVQGAEAFPGQKVDLMLELANLYATTPQWQLAIPWYNDAVSLADAAGNRIESSSALSSLALLYQIKKDHESAARVYQRKAEEERLLGEPGNRALALVDAGMQLQEAKMVPEALAVFTEAAEVCVNQDPERCSSILALQISAQIYVAQGKIDDAITLDNKALEMARQTHRLDEAANLLNDMGDANEAHDWEKAVNFFRQMAAVRKEQGAAVGQGLALQRIAPILTLHGEWRQAITAELEAAEIYRAAGEPDYEGSALLVVGAEYGTRGLYESSIAANQRAASAFRSAQNRSSEAVALNNLAFAFIHRNRTTEAIAMLRHVVTIRHEEVAAADAADINIKKFAEMDALENLGIAEQKAGRLVASVADLQRVLAIAIALNLNDRAETMIEIGDTYQLMGQRAQALAYFRQALPWVTGYTGWEAMVYSSLMNHFRTERPVVAIFFGKQAIDKLQHQREDLLPDKESKKQFLKDNRPTYENLAELLIEQGRLAEAQQVLDLMKEQEFARFTRGAVEDSSKPLALTAAETQAEEDYQRSTASLMSDSAEFERLRQQHERSAADEQRYAQLADNVKSANRAFDDYLQRLYVTLGKPAEANSRIVDIDDQVGELQEQIATMPHTVALYTVLTNDRYSVIVITGTTRVARHYVISQAALDKKITQFESVLRNPDFNPKPMAEELYRILVAPVKMDLMKADAHTLVWSLTGSLRYVPIAALYDGHHYLVQDYNSVTITPTSLPHLAQKPDVQGLRAVAMGISLQYEKDLPELSGVENELNAIVRDPATGSDGVLPGTLLLNGQFTVRAMESELTNAHPVVHIASHFVLDPGDGNRSYLLLAGDQNDAKGYHLTVADFREDAKLSLRSTDLLTLSACQTGVGGTLSDGREVDGLGMTAQRKGAKAIISTLWEVDDDSTSLLMANFYQRWLSGAGTVMKVEALRHAQMDLLEGKVKPKYPARNPYQPTGFAHPFYWAAFVMMGNWQ